MAGTILVSGSSLDDTSGQRILGPWNLPGFANVGETLYATLAPGDNTFTVPAGAVAVVLVPPANSTTAVTYRTSANSGDTGLPLNAGALPNVHAFPATPPTSVTVHAAGAVAGFVLAFV